MRTWVITPGPRRSAVLRAYDLLGEAVPSDLRFRLDDDWYSDQPKRSGQPEIDAWFVDEAKRRERFDRANPLERDTAYERDLRDLRWDVNEKAQRLELRRLERRALVSLAKLTSRLGAPIPVTARPDALVTPNENWIARPRALKLDDRAWGRHVEAMVDRYRGGHCIVQAHCRRR